MSISGAIILWWKTLHVSLELCAACVFTSSLYNCSKSMWDLKLGSCTARVITSILYDCSKSMRDLKLGLCMYDHFRLLRLPQKIWKFLVFQNIRRRFWVLFHIVYIHQKYVSKFLNRYYLLIIYSKKFTLSQSLIIESQLSS